MAQKSIKMKQTALRYYNHKDFHKDFRRKIPEILSRKTKETHISISVCNL